MYKVIGADQAEYGPVSAGQLGEWIAEGRANAASLVWAQGAVEWRPLAAIPEFATALKSASTPPQVIGPTISRRAGSNGLAIAGLVLGILSVVLFWLPIIDQVFAVLGLIFSLVGWSRAKSNAAQGTGRGAAIGGTILSVLGLLMGVAMLLLVGTIVAMNGN
jgi:hypothetical protein